VVKKECEGPWVIIYFWVFSHRAAFIELPFTFYSFRECVHYTLYITRYKFVYFSTPTIERFQRIHKIFNDNNNNNNNSYSNDYPILLFFLCLNIGLWFLRAMVSRRVEYYYNSNVAVSIAFGMTSPKEAVSLSLFRSGRRVLLTLVGWWSCGIPSVCSVKFLTFNGSSCPLWNSRQK